MLGRRLDWADRGLDIAEPGIKFLTSYGSSAGSDAFIINVQPPFRPAGQSAQNPGYIARRTEIDYATYVRYRGEITIR